MTTQIERGFSLIELMVTVAVLAIIVAIAVPSFTALINNNRLTSAANAMNAALQQARVEAMRRNARVYICSSSNADAATPTCSGSSTWQGWIMFLDSTHAGTPASADSVLARGTFRSPLTAVSMNNITSGTLFYQSDGFARALGGTAFLSSVIRICIPTTKPSQNIRDVVVYSGSRFAIDSNSGGGACAAPTAVP